jgi:RNA polymerase sigma-70 factor (ECF subfamily)
MNAPADSDPRAARFERLFRAEYGLVADYIGRRAEHDLVDDLVEEVFVVAWRRLERVPEDPRPWLLGVARNVLGTHIRGARRSRALGVRLALHHIDQTAPPSSAGQSDVVAALAALAPKDREALLLVNWEGLSPTEAARVLNERPATFRMRLHRARGRLRRALERRDDGMDESTVSQEIANA